MKKKITALGLVAVMGLSVAGCGNKYVKLGDYKDMEVKYYTSQTEITDENVTAEIESRLEDLAQEAPKNYKAKNGDTVNIDYKGLKDGKAFDGGTAQGYDLELGSGSFIDGFEDGLIGAKKGEKRSLNLTFPENYGSEDLAGKDVVFKVTVNKISIVPSMEDLDDAFVKKNIEGYDTLDAYKASVKEELQADLDKSIEDAKETYAWNQAVDNCEIKDYPEDQVDELVKKMEDYYTEYAQTYGVSLDDLLESSGSSREEFDENNEKSAKEEVANRVITDLIAEKEDLVLTDEEYEEGVKQYAEEYQYASADDMKEQVGEDELRVELQRDKVKKFLVENSTLTYSEDVKPTEVPTTE